MTNLIDLPAPKTGREAAQWILDQITTYPETYDQGTWECQEACGTTRCVAGWAAFLFPEIMAEAKRKALRVVCSGYVETYAFILTGMQALDISENEARWLFHGLRTQDDVCLALKEKVNGDPVTMEFLSPILPSLAQMEAYSAEITFG